MLAMSLAAAIKFLLILLLPAVAAAVEAAASALATTVGLSTVVDALIVVLSRLHLDLLLGSTMSLRKNGPVWQIVPELIGREQRFESLSLTPLTELHGNPASNRQTGDKVPHVRERQLAIRMLKQQLIGRGIYHQDSPAPCRLFHRDAGGIQDF
jgi:hypothetical protein